MTTLPQGELPNDPGILKTVADHHRVMMPALQKELPAVGVAVSVVTSGRITRGDEITPPGMTYEEVIFYVVAAVTVIGSIGVVTARNVVHSALFLILALLAVAGVFILLAAEFLAIVQVLIYGGAVTILVLFAMMLTRVRDMPIALDGPQTPSALLWQPVAFIGDVHLSLSRRRSGRARRKRSTSSRSKQIGERAVHDVGRAVRDRVAGADGGAGRRDRPRARRRGRMIPINHFLVLSTILFSLGMYGVLARRNAVLILMSVELMLQAVSINFVAFAVYLSPDAFTGDHLRDLRDHDRGGRGWPRARHHPASLPQPGDRERGRSGSDAEVGDISYVGMEEAWLIPALPAAAFVVLLLTGKYLPRGGDYIAIAAIGASFVIFCSPC